MQQSTLYIFCGLPFSGKTTVAKELAVRFGLPRIDLDEINGEKGVGVEGGRISDVEWQDTYETSYRRTRDFLQNGRSVIYDATNFTKNQRARLRNIAVEQGVESKVVFVDLSKDEAKRRLNENRARGIRYDVRDEDFDEVANNFQPPTEEEHVLRYDWSEPIDEWIMKHFPFMS